MTTSTPDARPDDEPVRQHRFRPPPGACDMLLVRHGETVAAEAGVEFPLVDGQSDPPLAAQGEAEAEAVAERLADVGIDAVWTTTLTRTQQTAAPLLARLGLEPQVEPDLREVFLGEWDGAEFRRRVRDLDPVAQRVFEDQDWRHIPGAESAEELGARVRGGIARIAAAHPDQRVAVFMHAGSIGAVLALATGAPPLTFVTSSNGSLNHVVVTDERWILRRFNDTAHLDTDLDQPPTS